MQKPSLPSQKSLWNTQNKGVAQRNAQDLKYEKINAVTTNELAQSRKALERKTLEYERLKRGWAKDLTDEQREEILVDFDAKYLEEPLDDDDLSEGDLDEPLIEVTDEFGRTRMARQSRIQRQPTPDDKLKPYILMGSI
jgi:hypothetical protein